jgi:hypothetical protein
MENKEDGSRRDLWMVGKTSRDLQNVKQEICPPYTILFILIDRLLLLPIPAHPYLLVITSGLTYQLQIVRTASPLENRYRRSSDY